MVLDYNSLFPEREPDYERLINGAGATKISNSVVANGWTTTTFTATKKCLLAGIIYYFNVTATPGAWDFVCEITQSGTSFNVVQVADVAVFNSGIQNTYFLRSIKLRAGDTVKFKMNYSGNMTLCFWGNVIVAVED